MLRGGFGMYRYHDEQNVQASALRLAAGSYDYTCPIPPAARRLTFAYIASITPARGAGRHCASRSERHPAAADHKLQLHHLAAHALGFDGGVLVRRKPGELPEQASNGTFGNINAIPVRRVVQQSSASSERNGYRDSSPVGTGAKPIQSLSAVRPDLSAGTQQLLQLQFVPGELEQAVRPFQLAGRTTPSANRSVSAAKTAPTASAIPRISTTIRRAPNDRTQSSTSPTCTRWASSITATDC